MTAEKGRAEIAARLARYEKQMDELEDPPPVSEEELLDRAAKDISEVDARTAAEARSRKRSQEDSLHFHGEESHQHRWNDDAGHVHGYQRHLTATHGAKRA